MEERNLYPLKFIPIFKSKIWGGTAIKDVLGLDFGKMPNCGEAWMLSGLEGEESVVANGFLEGNTLVDLVEVYMGDLVGDSVYRHFGLQFPLLFKWIDAAADLSVQVHPDNGLAMEREGCLGKDELWFVRQAEMGARLICGFRHGVNQMKYLKALKEDRLEEVLNEEPVDTGDMFYVPAGTVHALRSGILLAEIQQSSDLTYRIYDWHRNGMDGKPRQLHIEQALKALRFEDSPSAGDKRQMQGRLRYGRVLNTSNTIVEAPHFQVNYLPLTQGIEKDFTGLDSFVVYLCSGGGAVLKADGKAVEIKQGELVLVPAVCEIVDIYPDTCGCELLETYIGTD
ncbi:MAG: class I mannose-6-phosphate isomerase [Bacteroidales bacterium]|nr:class I mannose-6-phosphate isomerase [Bacteroidales bacterium]